MDLENNYMIGAETYFNVIAIQHQITNNNKGKKYFYHCLLKEV